MYNANQFVKALAAKYPAAKTDNLQDCIVTSASEDECKSILQTGQYPTVTFSHYQNGDSVLAINEDDNESA